MLLLKYKVMKQQGNEMNYTELEIRAIMSFEYAFNYDNMESEIYDNATGITAVDIARETGMEVNVAKGVMGSLTKKGLLEDWGEPDMVGVSYIPEEGIRAYYKLKEQHDVT